MISFFNFWAFIIETFIRPILFFTLLNIVNDVMFLSFINDWLNLFLTCFLSHFHLISIFLLFFVSILIISGFYFDTLSSKEIQTRFFLMIAYFPIDPMAPRSTLFGLMILAFIHINADARFLYLFHKNLEKLFFTTIIVLPLS